MKQKQQLPALMRKDEKAEKLHKGSQLLPAGAGTKLAKGKLVFSIITANIAKVTGGLTHTSRGLGWRSLGPTAQL